MQLRVQLLAATLDDLERYMLAIEEAMRQYHQKKICEINDRIQELWIETYQGKDIENIEIESKSIDRGSKKRFDYTVYMKKVQLTVAS